MELEIPSKVAADCIDRHIAGVRRHNSGRRPTHLGVSFVVFRAFCAHPAVKEACASSRSKILSDKYIVYQGVDVFPDSRKKGMEGLENAT